MAFSPQNLIGILILALIFIVNPTVGQHDPHFLENRTTVAHLFEWRWVDIAAECERFLGPYGYAGVQVSPPNENVVAFRVNENGRQVERPWWERYQPVSYKLVTRSGNEEEFKDMVRKCNTAGVRVYVDAVINHMTYTDWGEGRGTGDSYFNTFTQQYDGVPYSSTDFNGPAQCPTPDGEIGDHYSDQDPQNRVIIRNCRLGTLHDLNQGVPWVRDRLVDYMNNLTSFGVAGFRVDASKHMWPEDLKLVYSRLIDLPTEHGFPEGARPFIFQEVIDNGGEAVSAPEYFELGRVTEFKACAKIGNVFRKWSDPPEQLSYLENWGEGETGWGFMPNGFAITFVDNHDNQRGHGAGGASILTFRVSRMYKMAQAFILAWPYGLTRVMSSFYWEQDFVNGKDFNDWIGPPHDESFNTLPVEVFDPVTNPITACGNGWICEHRWRQIYNMVRFRNIVQGTAVNNWWANKDRIAFSRDGKGFLAINNDVVPFIETVPTSLPDGTYCDVISGSYENGSCTGKTITVTNAHIQVNILETEEDPMIATHIGAKLP